MGHIGHRLMPYYNRVCRVFREAEEENKHILSVCKFKRNDNDMRFVDY